MRKQLSLLVCLAALLVLCTGCSFSALPEDLSAPDPKAAAVPQHMVRQIRVTLQPEESGFERVYTGKVVLNRMIRMLREIPCETPAPDPGALDRADSYYSIVFTYADGGSREFRLLSHQYFNNARDGWVEIPREQALELTEFITHSRTGESEDSGFSEIDGPQELEVS